MSAAEPHDGVDRALNWLAANQSATGELPAWASPLEDEEPVWLPDSMKFITALAAMELHTVKRGPAPEIVDRSIEFLRAERERSSLWRYWSQSNEQYGFTPPDADDTACCSMAVATRGDSTPANVAILLANRDPSGRFYTWLVPHRRSFDPRLAWALHLERKSSTRVRRDELWATTEADPDDVDVVVNANVCRYLGPRRAPAAAVEWVASTLEAGGEIGADKWHRNATTFYLSVADGGRRGVTRFAALGPLLTERITSRWAAGTIDHPLDRAQALRSLQAIDSAPRVRAEITEALRDTQRDDGSWHRSIFYFGGPKEVFGWASEALTTAYAAAALHSEATR